MTYEEIETWDVYDSKRQLTGRTMQRTEPIKTGDYHLVVHLCLFDADGRMLLQKRASTKQGWPGYWDFSCGGSALAGENSRQAMQREAGEEIGFHFDFKYETPLFTISCSFQFDDYYFLKANIICADMPLQQSEVSSIAWFSFAEIMELVKEDKCIPYPFWDDVFKIYRQWNSIKKEG